MGIEKEVEVTQVFYMFVIGKHTVDIIFTTKAFIGNTVQIFSQDYTLYMFFIGLGELCLWRVHVEYSAITPGIIHMFSP